MRRVSFDQHVQRIAAIFILMAISGVAIQVRPAVPRALAAPPLTPSEQNGGAEKIAPKVRAAMASLQEGEKLSVIVTLREQADLSAITDDDRASRLKKVVEARQATAEATQAALRKVLADRRSEGLVDETTFFWVMNGLTVTGAPEVIEELAARAEVSSITPNEILLAPAPPAGVARLNLSAVEGNLAVAHAPALWDLGFRGNGIVVANLDTGVDVTHPDLAAQWRGGTNSWFDPYGQHPTTPVDLKGHGTWTMGVMVGRDASGTAVGVAPDARWIAAKVFSDQGTATVEAIHKAFQWVLDPDNNPNTPDAPHVVNNSWGYQYPGCVLEFQLDLQALRAAGIVPIFAAGNTGPGTSTSVSPANNPEAFAVGATDDNGLVFWSSARGPTACGGPPTVYPEVTAPGVNIRTTDLFGTYTFVTGTSLAAPHVAGVLALLLSAYPNLTVAEQEAALLSSSVDLGVSGPDNDYGYGGLDALAAYRWLAAGGNTIAPSTISVGLFPGLNLVSLRLAPDGSAAPAAVLGSIAGRYDRVYAARACDVADPWKVYDPAVPDFVNDLEALDPTMGLWVKMTAAGILTVSGTAPSSTAVPLCSGWNLIGYPSIQKRPPAEVLAPIAGLFERVYTFDAGDPSDPWKLYDPAVPNFVNDISVFQVGFGYWIKMKDSVEPMTLTIED